MWRWTDGNASIPIESDVPALLRIALAAAPGYPISANPIPAVPGKPRRPRSSPGRLGLDRATTVFGGVRQARMRSQWRRREGPVTGRRAIRLKRRAESEIRQSVLPQKFVAACDKRPGSAGY